MKFRCRDCAVDFTVTLADGSCPDCYNKESVEERAPPAPENPAGISVGIAAPKETPGAILYVGDLAPEVTEAMLLEKFSAEGPVLSVRVCRDMVTLRAVYAYVDFRSPSDAARAMDTLNYVSVQGRPMRITWSSGKPALRQSSSGNIITRKDPSSSTLYVGDLAPEVTDGILFEKFSSAGEVLSVRVIREAGTKRSLGYAYVNFRNLSDAARAMDTLNYDPLKGRPMRIMWSQHDPSLRQSGNGNIFIKGLDETVDSKLLYETFSRFGTILSCKLALDDRGRSRGHAFVQFESETAAQEAIKQVNGTVIGGQEVFVGRFISRAERERGQYEGVNLIIKNLDESITDQALQSKFAEFGNISSSKVMMENGRSKGYGFVCYSTSESASRAIQEMHGKVFGSQMVSVEFAPRKNERQAPVPKQITQRSIPYQSSTQINTAPRFPSFAPPTAQFAATHLNYAPRGQPDAHRFRPPTARRPVPNAPITRPILAPVPVATRMPAAPRMNRNGFFQNRPAVPTQQTVQTTVSSWLNNPPMPRYLSSQFAPIPEPQPMFLDEPYHNSRIYSNKKSGAAKKKERQAALQKPVVPVKVEAKLTISTTSSQEKDDRKCCVCLDQDKCILFRPCRHVAVCAICSDKVITCPICRKDVLEREPVFI